MSLDKHLFNIFSNKPFKPFYNAFIPRSTRKQWYFRYVELPVQVEVAEYWQSVINKYQAGDIEHYYLQPKQYLSGKKIIWQYWSQGMDNLPNIVKLCFASVDKYKDDYHVIRLSDDNIADYIDFPNFIYEKRQNSVFKTVFFSDLLRIALIYLYGGVWLDASILLTAKLPKQYENYDIFMYSRDQSSIHKDWGDNDVHFYFNWRPEFKVKHLSSIIYGKAGTNITKVMLDLLLEFWKTQTEIKHYFFFQIMINELMASDIVNCEFLIADDTFPHLLQGEMNKTFDKERYQYIIEHSDMHKLSLHDNLKKRNIKGHETFYGILAKNYNI